MKKILTLFSFLLLFTLFFTISTYASEITLPDYSSFLTKENSEHIILKYTDSNTNKVYTYLYVYNSDVPLPSEVRFSVAGNGVIRVDNETTGYFVLNEYVLDNGTTWRKTGTKNCTANSYFTLNYDGTLSDILVGTINIYSSPSSDEFFFPVPPQVETTILAPIVGETETSKILAEVKIILPTILVVLVSFLGLRKALKMLSTLLHRS